MTYVSLKYITAVDESNQINSNNKNILPLQTQSNYAWNRNELYCHYIVTILRYKKPFLKYDY